jgi:L-threonylcarbamoyladenylate synthase
MKIIQVNLKGDYSRAVTEAVAVLKLGGVIVYPTDTVYGLGSNACDWQAAEQVFKIKQRSLNKPLPIIARNMIWVKELAYVSTKMETVLTEIWPGPTTVILPKKKIIPDIVTAKKKNVGIRIPASELTDDILAKFGYPLTATSANISGQEASGKIGDVINFFKDQIWKPDLIIDAGNLPKSDPSTVLDMSAIKPKITRIGPTKPEQLLQLLKIKSH